MEKGDNLSRISAIYGVTLSELMEWNGLSNPGMIRTGQSLIVSQSGGGEASSPQNDVNVIVPRSEAPAPVADPSSTLQDFLMIPPQMTVPLLMFLKIPRGGE